MPIHRIVSIALFIILSVILLAGFSAPSYAVPACPDSFELAQPGGGKFRARKMGDEFQNWTETEGGYTVTKNSATGAWEYARRNASGRLEGTGIRVRPGVKPPKDIQKGIRPDRDTAFEKGFKEHVLGKKNAHTQNSAPGQAEAGSPPAPGEGSAAGAPALFSQNWDPVPVSGSRNLLIVLTAFADRAFTTTPAQWNAAIFDNTSGVKSVVNYYNDNSRGNLAVTPVSHSQAGNPVGIISVTLASNHPNYGNNFYLSTEKAWLQEAMNIITTNGWVDFSALDTSSDGVFQNEELVVYFIPAGYEASGSSKTPNIWAHAWGSTPGVNAGGVELRKWAMNGELNNIDNRHPMGVITHELGHSMCGLPDLYDYSYTNPGMGAFSLMAAGSWGRLATGEDSGTTPVTLDAWSRQYIGWTTPVQVQGPDTYTFHPALDPANSPLKLINQDVSTTQYFLAENRYNEGWDLGLERWLGAGWNGGILIQHIDVNAPINDYVDGGHQGVMVEEASTVDGSLLANTSQGEPTHMFYDPNNSAFSSSTSPNSGLYDGTTTGLSLTGISTKGRIMSATVDPAAAAVPSLFPKAGGTGNLIVDAAAGYEWTAASNESWITLDAPAGGTGSGTVGFTVSANQLDDTRQGTVSVAGQTVAIYQEGSLTVTPTSVSAGPESGNGVVLVNCSPGYAWNASSNEVWITIVSGSSGTGPGVVSYSVDLNNDPYGRPRQGTITVAGRTVTVDQDGDYFENCASPRIIGCLPYTDESLVSLTFPDISDPIPTCSPGGDLYNTVWYAYTPSTFHNLTIDTLGSNYDTLIAVFEGTCDTLFEVTCNDDINYPVELQSSVTFSVTPGITYYIMIGGVNFGSGTLFVNADCSGGECPICPGPEHCSNFVQDADEKGIDCGGADCPTCDTIAPASLITDTLLTSSELTVTGMASDGGGGGVSGVFVSIDGQPALAATDTSGNGSWSSWSYTPSMPADGNHTIQSMATDLAYNSEVPSDSVTLFVDNTAPTSSIVNPSNGMVISGSSYSVSGTADDGTGSGVIRVEVSTNGGLTWEPTEYSPGQSWSYTWTMGSAGSHNIRSRATDNEGHVELPGAGVTVTVNTLGSPELAHNDWDACLSGGGCTVCHHTPSTFLPPDYKKLPGFCRSCHNAAAPAHDRNIPAAGHSMFASVTSAGLRAPTYGNITSAGANNQPFSRLYDGDKTVCVTCHNPMSKTEDMGRVWEDTSTTDNLTYTMLNGGWAQSGPLSPKVYRDTSLWSGPSYVKDRKDYLVDPSTYSFNEYSGTLEFSLAQDPLDYIYVTLDYPYLRASNASNTLCSDCHTQLTHRGVNCLTCHISHGTTNMAGIRGTVRTTDRSERAVVFTDYSGTNSFADGDTAYDGICEVCHTATKYHRRDGTGFANHSGGINQSGKDCSSCHTHASGFAR